MEIAKITSRGQVSIPTEIRKKLGVDEGDKIVFIERQGQIVIINAAKITFADVELQEPSIDEFLDEFQKEMERIAKPFNEQMAEIAAEWEST